MLGGNTNPPQICPSSSGREGIAKSPSTQEVPPTVNQSTEVDNLIVQLTKLLENWESYGEPNEMATQVGDSIDKLSAGHDEADPINILATKIHSANAPDQDHYLCSTQFDVEEHETYARAMQGPNAAQWAQAMEEELYQLNKNDTWILTPKSAIQPSHRPLEGNGSTRSNETSMET